MKYSVILPFLVASFALLSTADNSDSAENLLSDATVSNNTDSSDGKVTIEEQYDEDNSTMTTSGTKVPASKSSSLPSSSTVQTTTPKSGKPRAPSFVGWSFFIGIIVAFLIIGIAVLLVRFFCQRRSVGNNVPYSAYNSA
ncbi:unnamed protein product [Caenorhabditis sp. 36 PRJEB53466]|nr:unnamed protein product [Caenorhabditis sp. 36 PRJEB53466]